MSLLQFFSIPRKLIANNEVNVLTENGSEQGGPPEFPLVSLLPRQRHLCQPVGREDSIHVVGSGFSLLSAAPQHCEGGHLEER